MHMTAKGLCARVFPGTSIKSSPNLQYIPGTAPPTPTAMASLTAVPEAASAPPPSIAPNPLFLNLLPLTPPHSLQTGDSNVFANTTIDSSCKEKVPQQQGQDINRPPSFCPLGQPLLSPESTSLLTVQVPIDEDSEEAVLEGQTMPLQYIVTPLQHPISVLQKAHSHAPASPPLVASDEMPPLESANRHPAPSQKLPTSKQPTSPAAPVSAPPVSSITPSPLSLNLLYYTPPHAIDRKKHPPPGGVSYLLCSLIKNRV